MSSFILKRRTVDGFVKTMYGRKQTYGRWQTLGKFATLEEAQRAVPNVGLYSYAVFQDGRKVWKP